MILKVTWQRFGKMERRDEARKRWNKRLGDCLRITESILRLSINVFTVKAEEEEEGLLQFMFLSRYTNQST